MSKIKGLSLFLFSFFILNKDTDAQTDTLRVLSYNLLYLGDSPPCQGPHSVYEGYLETIIAYENPDIAGFVKMEAIPMYSGNMSGSAPAGFADSLLKYSLNAAFPGRYAYCSFTNTSGADNMSLLFYNQQKLGFVNILTSYSNITDFDTYKLYYKSPDLATTHDSIFLYVTLNHTNSGTGSSNEATREAQIAGEMAQIESHFTSLPNMINMGDFNVHSSSEACYQTLVAPSNLANRYYDPPFYPDATYTYPADWDTNPATYAACLTVSTRESTSSPNGCSSDVDGAKSWYDHIFLSANIVTNADHICYIPHSFRVIGNDGNRVGNPVNSSPANTSAPATVINSIFQLSEHYPIALNLIVNLAPTSTAMIQPAEENVTLANPVNGFLDLHFAQHLEGKIMNMTCTDVLGRLQISKNILSTRETMHIPCSLVPGIYYLKFSTDDHFIAQMTIWKK